MQITLNASALSAAELHSLPVKVQRKISNDKTSPIFWCNHLLFEEKKMVNKPIISWVNELRQIIYSQRAKKQKLIPQLVTIFNEAIHVFIAQGCYKQARECCYSQVQVLINAARQNQDIQVLKFGINAWINLARIDRLEGNYYDAHKKINILLDKKPFCENQLFHAALYQDATCHREMIRYAQLEKIKLYFMMNRYEEIIQDFSMNHTNFGREALIIAYAKLGKHAEALEVICNAKNNTDSQFIFTLRECEISWHLFRDEKIAETVYDIYKTSLRAVQSSQVTTHHIQFSLTATHLMNNLGMYAESNALTYYCLQAACLLQDEILKADCMVKMYEQIATIEGRQIIEDMMIEHYHQTFYVQARQQMLACFQDLKHVELNVDTSTLDFLLDDLCSWIS